MKEKYLLTGATGLIGSALLRQLVMEDYYVTCPIRNKEKAKGLFNEEIFNKVCWIEMPLETFLQKENKHFDYIIHCASPTSGKYMMEHPVETFEFIVESTRVLLQYSYKNKIKEMVYVSSLEYYGQNFNEDIITEDFEGFIEPTSPRSSYPLGKRAAEFLCVAYATEYKVPVKIARLTQTFGPGISADDNRVFAQFARSAINKEDIILHTAGESAKPYCHVYDCISAILTILHKGIAGEAYNVANENTYISIKDMADFVQVNFNPECRVLIQKRDDMGYAPVTKLRLSTEKLQALGWKPKFNLKDMFSDLITYMAFNYFKEKET